MFYQIIKTSGNCCGSACCGSETVIWETKDHTKYASKVFTDGIGACTSASNVSVYLMNGDILHFNKAGCNKPWLPASNKIRLDLGKTSSTIFYDFHHDGEKRTFTAKPGYMFKTVILKSSWRWTVCWSSCCKCGCLADKVFWEAQKDDECSTKVEVYGVESNIRNINIFLNNNEVRHFHKVKRKWLSSTAIVMDIGINQDNNLFEYRSTRGFGHFNPRANLSITNIVKKELKIWSAKDRDYGLKVVLMGAGKDEKHISILLQSGGFVLLQKTGVGKPWQDITQNKHNFSGVKLYSLEEGTSQYTELTRNDYDPVVFESRFGYEFNDGVRCVRVTLMDVLVWTHTDDTEFGYPKGLYLDLLKNRFMVTSPKDQTRELDVKIDVSKAKVAPVKVTPVVTPEIKQVITPAVTAPPTPVALDIEKKQTTTEYDHKDDNGVVTYTPKSGYLFSKVSEGQHEIWKSAANAFGKLVRTKETRGINYLVVLLTSRTFSLFQESDKEWKDITKDRHYVTKLKFYGEGDAVLKETDYDVTIVDMSFSHTFKSGVKCVKVKLGQEVVWSHTDDPKFKEITVFSLGLASNCFFIKNPPGEVKI
ncbi:hypothetical protein TpMuguga_02g00691 [Theileria parva strain Muguga]|uniref:Uncharacterized protein n=1 Tax=Theileria parva TaxID=5875 RepID=Q4N4E9_THEPA|nr:uncharacterized protein TpMuguga_02g00691 [Theileria parva strain Muguga]EAN32974.1 hypothetical protein TpMuguga_02g00691 [Theileria parva strain Muguga]|eukprot:XP_765257.1 hypothetical protein [Theileria parva strain Muguga]